MEREKAIAKGRCRNPGPKLLRGTGAFVTCPAPVESAILGRVYMSEAPQRQREKRGARVKLGGSVLALLQLQNRRQVRGRLSQLSATEVSCIWRHRSTRAWWWRFCFTWGRPRCGPRWKCCFRCGPPRDACSLSASKTFAEELRGQLEKDLNALLKVSPGAVGDDVNLP